MPWEKKTVEDQRNELIIKIKQQGYSISEACRMYGISRPTAYKWLKRYKQQGLKGLRDQSKRRKGRHPDTIPNSTLCEIIKMRQAYPFWGGRNIRTVLTREKLVKNPPHARTIDRWIKRAGFVIPKIKNPRVKLPESILIKPTVPNMLWSTDFKGWWEMQSGKKCYPLTTRDVMSKYLIMFDALAHESFELTKDAFIKAFKTFGLPLYIRSDNGKPFATTQNPWGLTRLSVWWLKLGITPIRIEPGKPYQNGDHERVHLDIARQLESCPEKTYKAEQVRFDRWRFELNEVRPHQALDMKTPSDVYSRSSRTYVGDPAYFYPDDYEVRSVSSGGQFCWGKKTVNFSTAFSGEAIGIEPVNRSSMRIWFRDYCLGTSDRDFKKPIIPVRRLVQDKSNKL